MLQKQISNFFSRFQTVPFLVSGLYPGTTISLMTEDRKEKLAEGDANENGEFRGRIPRRFIGKLVYAPVRHTGFEYDQDFVLMIQPWGLSRAVRQRVDRNYAGGAPATQKDMNERYIRAEAETQFEVRQILNRTVYFWALVIVGIIAAAIEKGVPSMYAYLVAVLAIVLKAMLARRALGLAVKAIHKD